MSSHSCRPWNMEHFSGKRRRWCSIFVVEEIISFCEDTVPRQRATQGNTRIFDVLLASCSFSVCWLFLDRGPSRVLTHERPMAFSSYLPSFDQNLYCLSMWKWCCQDVLRLQFLSVMFTSSTLTRLGELTLFLFDVSHSYARDRTAR